ncbi:MAG: hypothetical protein MUF34_10005 [Polyangiaceae bacterium]|jgi:hypothetical protein|nr:hypothetical protein [Polyangiaceae bacterium]
MSPEPAAPSPHFVWSSLDPHHWVLQVRPNERPGAGPLRPLELHVMTHPTLSGALAWWQGDDEFVRFADVGLA